MVVGMVAWGRTAHSHTTGSNSMSLRISQLLDRDGNTGVSRKVETNASFQNKPTFGRKWKHNLSLVSI